MKKYEKYDKETVIIKSNHCLVNSKTGLVVAVFSDEDELNKFIDYQERLDKALTEDHDNFDNKTLD